MTPYFSSADFVTGFGNRIFARILIEQIESLARLPTR